MQLKRNLFTVLYSLFFVAFFGLGLMQLVYLSVTNSDNRNIIACIIILGIIIYLIAAFFIKEKGSFQIVQRNTPVLIVAEVLFTVLICGGLFYLMMDKGMDNGALIALMLVSIFLSGRLLGGRLCGFMALLIGFFFILTMANMDFDAEQYINTLCFLLPYALFLFITKVLTRSFVDSGFIIFISYLALSVIFALFIVLNPLTCILLFGCVFSLLFGKPEKKGSIVAAGPFSACILLVCTVLLLVGIRLYMPDVFLLPELDVDIFFLRSTSYLEIAEYVIEKYTKAVNHLYQPFQLGIFPSILMFLGCASGYYAIRKKSSGIGPLCLTYLLVLTYYLLCSEPGSHFYYMTYFLPVFAAYGFYNTLLSDEMIPEKKKKADDAPENKEEQEEVENPIEKKEKAEKLVEVAAEEQKPVEKEPEKPEPVEKELEQPKPAENEPEQPVQVMKEPVEAKSVKAKEKKAMMKSDEIPEWHAPEGYSSGQQAEEKETPEEIQTEYVQEEISDITNEEPVAEESVLEEPVVEESVVEEPIVEDDVDEELADHSLIEEGLVDIGLAGENTEDNTDVLETNIGDNGDDNDTLTFEDEDKRLNNFLDRLDISENIRRMNESAQEDMADIIEREDAQEELLSAIPMEDLEVIEGADGKLYADSSPSELQPERISDTQEETSTLPKYEKPDFDYKIEPVTESLQETYTNISEYDEVPTIQGLEREWKNTEKAEKGSGFAYSLDDVKETEEEEAVAETSRENYNIHSEEVIRKSGIGKRSYHKITIE